METSDYIAVASCVIAVLALGASVVAVVATRRVSMEERAAEAIKGYLELSLQYPKYSAEKKSDTYDWYVAYILIMAQEVLDAYKGSKKKRWKSIMRAQLSYHDTYLIDWEKSEPGFANDFGPEVSA